MDNLGNSESSYFDVSEPVEQKQERNEERAKVQGGKQLLEELIERMTTRIAFYDSVKSIPDDVKTRPDEFMHTVAANELTVANLMSEKEYLENLRTLAK